MTRSKRKQWEGRLGELALRWAERWLSRKSRLAAEESGARLGRLLFRLAKKRRERAIANLELAFPELAHADRVELARRVFEHFGRITADFLTSRKRTWEELDASMTVRGFEYLEEALAKGKGGIFITGHFGNWERMSAWAAGRGYPITVVSRDANQTGVNEMVNQLRSKTGSRVIGRGNSARTILERLRKAELIGILPDQNSDDIFLPFFDKPAGTVLGPGVLAERTGAPVLCAWCVWTGPGRYELTIEPPIEPEPGCEQKGEGTMRAINAALERAIREHPEQWLWFHDRWRNARRRGLL